MFSSTHGGCEQNFQVSNRYLREFNDAFVHFSRPALPTEYSEASTFGELPNSGL